MCAPVDPFETNERLCTRSQLRENFVGGARPQLNLANDFRGGQEKKYMAFTGIVTGIFGVGWKNEWVNVRIYFLATFGNKNTHREG